MANLPPQFCVHFLARGIPFAKHAFAPIASTVSSVGQVLEKMKAVESRRVHPCSMIPSRLTAVEDIVEGRGDTGIRRWKGEEW